MTRDLIDRLPALSVTRCDPAKNGLNWSVFLAPSDIVPAARILLEAECFIEDITAIDAAEGFVVVYHFSHFTQPSRVALRVLTPHDAPQVPSIAGVFQGAEWHERETRDFYGIEFAGNPNPLPLVLSEEDAVEPPLRKEPGARARVADMICSGEVVRCQPGFDLLTPAPAEAAEEKPKSVAKKKSKAE